MAVDKEQLVQEIRIHLNKRSARTVERLFTRLEKTEEKIKKLSSMKIAPKVDNAAIKRANKDLEKLKVDRAIRRSQRDLDREKSFMTSSQRGSAQGVLTRQTTALTAAIAAGVPVEKALAIFQEKRAASMEKITEKTAEAKKQAKYNLDIQEQMTREINKASTQQMKAARQREALIQRSGDKIESGYEASNLRPDQMQKHRTELARLNKEFRNGSINVRQYRDGVKRLDTTIRKGTGLRRLANQLRDVRHAVAGLSAAYAAFSFGSQAFRIGADFESIRATMLMASGDMRVAGEDMKFVTAEANRLGKDLKFAADGFVKLSVASRDKLDPDQVKELFTGFSEFATAMGTDSFRYEKGIMAIGQMLSKGQIYREELVGQLAEQMPGALQVFSRALNVTDAELLKMSERGELLAKDVFPLVAKEFSKAANAGGALAQQLKNPAIAVQTMRNKFKEMVHEFFRSGFGRAISNLAVAASGFLEVIKAISPVLGGAFLGALTAITLPLAIISDSLRLIVMFLSWIGDKVGEIFGKEAGETFKKWAFGLAVAIPYLLMFLLTMGKVLKVIGKIGRLLYKILPDGLKNLIGRLGKVLAQLRAAMAMGGGKGGPSGGVGKRGPMATPKGAGKKAAGGLAKGVGKKVAGRAALLGLTPIPVVGQVIGAALAAYTAYEIGSAAYDAIKSRSKDTPESAVLNRANQIQKTTGAAGNTQQAINLNITTEESEFFKTKVDVVDQVGNVRNNISE